MKKIISIILFLLFQQNVYSQTVGSFNGIQNTSNSFEKLFDIPSFPNGVSNLAVDFSIGNISFWGYIELEITGFFNYQNTPGKLTKVFAIGTNPNGLIYENESRVLDALGAIANNISIGDFKWDASNNRFSIPISHIVPTMNSFTLKVKAFSHGGGANTLVNSMFISPQYVLPALARNFISFNDKVGIGTTSPVSKLHVNGDITVASGSRIVYDPVYDVHGYTKFDYSGMPEGALLTYSYYGNRFQTRNGIAMVIRGDDNNVGIGTTTPAEKLSVNGNIRAKKLIVSQTGWPDFVFSKSYKLRSLKEVENYINENQHLPEVPSAKEVAAKGISVGDTQALLLKKIEELTLYIIELKKENIDLSKRIYKLELK